MEIKMTNMIGYNDWQVEYPWNIHDCIKCSAWNGTGCTLTACCRTKTYYYKDGKLVELGVEDEN